MSSTNNSRRPFQGSRGQKCALPHTSLHEIVLEQCHRTPHLIAIKSDAESLTYAELDRRSSLWAAAIIDSGIKEDQLVGIALERSPELICAVLGILRAGCAYVPLDVNYPQKRLQLIIYDAQLSAVIEDPSAKQLTPQTGVVITSRLAHPIRRKVSLNGRAWAERPAYVIYTSGSTGQPKGIVISHRNAVNFVVWAQQTYSPDELAFVLAGTSISFDLSIFEIFVPLSIGGTIVLVPDALVLADDKVHSPITLINTVPSVMRQLLALSAIPRTVQTVNLAGEVLDSALVNAVRRHRHVKRLVNLYGPSETTTYSTFCEVRRADTSPPIGRPIFNTSIYLLDSELRPVRRGEPGEICIAGLGVSLGYLNRPDETQRRFIKNPFEVEFPLLYRSGDLGVWRDTGELAFIGRKDDLVKIRGYRIELGEIEESLRNIKDIRDVAVVAQDFGRHDLRLVAYIVADEEAWPDLRTLRGQLEVELPPYMIPSMWIRLGALPRLPNGKVNRQALKSQNTVPPRPKTKSKDSDIRQIITREFADLLGVPELLGTSNFFEIGGDSLLAARLIVSLRTALNRPLHITDVHRFPTIDKLVIHAKSLPVRRPRKINKAAATLRTTRFVPLSDPQRRLWLFNKVYTEAAVHNVTLSLSWLGEFDAGRFIKACKALAECHVPLKSSRIREHGSQVAYDLTKPCKLPVRSVDALTDDQVRQLRQAEAARPFDLANEPPWRALVIRRNHDNHEVLFTLHHIIVDASSLEIFLTDFTNSYALKGKNASESQTVFNDYGLIRRELSKLRRDSDRHLEYWRERINSSSDPFTYPVDVPRTNRRTFAAECVTLELNQELTEQISDYCARRSITPYVLLLTSFVLVLHKWSGSERVDVGSVFSLRDTGLFQGLLGFHGNVLPITSFMRGGESDELLMERMADAISLAHAHKHCPADSLQAELSRSSRRTSTPLLPIMFGLRPHLKPISIEGLRVNVAEVFPNCLEAELNLQVLWSHAGSHVTLDFNRHLFKRDTVEWLAGEFLRAVERIATRSGGATTLTRREAGAETFTQPLPASLSAAFEASAAAHADRVALTCGNERWTYRELLHRSLGVAEELRQQASQKFAPVGIIAEDQAQGIVGLLAVLRCGYPFVPLNPGNPAARLRKIIDRAGISTLLADEKSNSLATELVGQSITRLNISEIEKRSELAWTAPAQAESYAYALFTSGTSGEPKGVVQNHRNVMYHALTYRRCLSLTEYDSLTMLTTIAFDAGMMDIFGALLSGAALHVWSMSHNGLEALHAWTIHNGITVFHSTPSVFRAVVNSKEWEQPPPSLRLVVLGGEVVLQSDLHLFQRRFGERCSLVNGYGPTESTLATQAFFNGKSSCMHSTLPIGKPVPGTEVVLVAPDGSHDVQFGEIEIRSPYVCLGYLQSPADWTRLNQVSTGPRKHRTGDLARLLPDGQLIFQGRKDRQIKIDGIRIEPAEIEQRLLEIKGVAEACIKAFRGRSGSSWLAAYVVMHLGQESNPNVLREKLATVLPDYMLPSVVMTLESLPRLPNGKVNESLLPRPHVSTRDSVKSAATALEETVGSIWQRALALDFNPTPQTRFFQLGGHSLAALTIVSEIHSQFGVRIKPALLLRGSSLAEFVEVVRLELGATPKREVVDEQTLKRRPLIPQQQRFRFLEKSLENSRAIATLVGLRFRTNVNKDLLQQALDLVISRHEILRSRICEDLAEAYVIIDPPGPADIAWSKLDSEPSFLDPASLPEGALRFDLRRQWPFSCFGWQTPKGDFLLLAFHHIAVDAWSVKTIVSELTNAYHSLMTVGCLPTLSPSGSFAAAASRLAQLSREVETRELDFWARELADAPLLLEFPCRTAGQTLRSLQAERQCYELPVSLVTSLSAFARENHVSKANVLLAGFSILLSHHTRQDDIVIGVPVTLRDFHSQKLTVGPLLNMVALRCRLSTKSSFLDHVFEVRDCMSNAITHSNVPFERVVQRVAPPRSAMTHPIFQTVFSYHEETDQTSESTGIETLEAFSGGITCDLALTVTCCGNQIHLDLDGEKTIFRRQMLRYMVEQFITLLTDGLERSDKPAHQLRLLPETQRHELINTLNRTTALERTYDSIVAAITGRVAITPEAIAVVEGEKSLTYEELNTAADNLAAELIDLGVRAGSFVPIWAERGCEFVIAMLGIIKTGAAFLPLDSHWPKSLVTQALEESDCDLIVGQPATITIPGVKHIKVQIQPGVTKRVCPAPAINGSKPMYAMYTSGTTGRPKAAVIHHQGIINRFNWMTEFLGPATLPVTIQTTAPVYDSAIWQTLWPLTLGGTSVVLPDEWYLDSRAFVELIARHRVNVLDFVPSVLTAMLPGLEQQPRVSDMLASVQWLILGGESLSSALVKRAWRLLPQARITNLYGPTEASIGCIYYEIVDEVPEVIPIGRPIPEVRALVLNEQQELAPRGSIGELCVLGECVGMGYLKRRNAGGFKTLSIPEFAGQKAYCTGDLVRWNVRAQLEYHGRVDRQVKIRGVRIEPEAIRAVLDSYRGIALAAVDAYDDESTQRRYLIAYVQPEPDSDLDVRRLKEYLRERLPPTHLPDRIEIVRELPLHRSGKPDLARLRQVVTDSAVNPRATESLNSYELTRSERQVRDIWKKVLREDREIGSDVNFFDAGGDSLLILELQREFETSLRSTFSIVDIFKYPTIEAQAKLLSSEASLAEPG